VTCNGSGCVWTVEVALTLTDKYSFNAYADNGTRLPWYTLDNNLVLRLLGLGIVGKEFDISDSRPKALSGSMSCVK
jgi:hypothetical protein